MHDVIDSITKRGLLALSRKQSLVAFEQAGSGITEFIQLHNVLYRPFSLWQYGKVDELIRGSATQNPRPMHTSFASEVIRFTLPVLFCRT